MQEKEIWKDIKGYEDLYQISNYGRVKRLEKEIITNYKYGSYSSIKKEKFLKTSKQNGYKIVSLRKDSKNKSCYLHRLIAETFISNPKNKPQVNHINGNKLDNRVDNLEWVTCKENNIHALRTGLRKPAKKVLQYDLQGNFIKEWKNVREIEKTLNISSSNIVACCLNRINQSYKYIWKYKKEDIIINTKIKPYQNSNEKPICQYNLQNKFIKKWNSLKEASNNLNISYTNISKCCNGKGKTAGGFIWKYAE